MKSAGLDVGRRYDKTTYLELEDQNITDIVQAGSIRFKEQAVFLYPRLRSCNIVIVDVTGVGQGLYECLEELLLPLIPATIVSGDKMKLYNGKLVVGKTFLIGLITTNLQNVEAGMLPRSEQQAFRQELAQFVVKNGKRQPKFEARSGHDDRVIALGLALAGVLVYDRFRQEQGQARQGSGKGSQQKQGGEVGSDARLQASDDRQGNGAGSAARREGQGTGIPSRPGRRFQTYNGL